MPVFTEQLEVRTQGRGMVEVTQELGRLTKSSGVKDGLAHVFILHTSASLLFCENADPDVRVDLERFMSDLVPDGDPRFVHVDEGPDDMAAHVRSVLTATFLTVPVRRGALKLGTWQGIYVWEHRNTERIRKLEITIVS